MITFFTIPRPFCGIYDIIQRNAILSWKETSSQAEILIYGNDPSVIQFANENDILCLDSFDSNSYGTPLLDKIWDSASKISSNDLVCFINSDIIVFSDFLNKIRQVKFEKFLLAGRRTDVDINYLINFESEWEKDLKNLIEREGSLHAETGSDYWIIPKSIMPNMPAFAIGRAWWDHWLIYYFRKNKIPVIDGTEIMTVHQNHDYSHVKSVIKGTSEKGQERAHNGKLANLKYWNILHITDSTHYWHKGEIYRTPISQKMSRIYFRYIRPNLKKIKGYFYK
jgi:hypothetical protein